MPMFALAEPESSFAAALPSTVLHGVMVAAAIAASQAVPVTTPTDHEEIVLSWPVPPAPHTPVSPGGMTLPGAPTTFIDRVPEVPVIGDVPTTGIPRVDPTQWVTGTDSLARQLGGDPRPGTQVLSESEVDDAPSLLAAGPLRYPQVLREAGITGSVTLAFIIDTEGRVEEQGIEVLAATHPGFVAAATETIRASRFHPAKSHGAAVRVRVRQTIAFRQ